MKALALVLILTSATGEQTEINTGAMRELDCLAAMRAIWESPYPTVAQSVDGESIPSVDAYCTTTNHKPE